MNYSFNHAISKEVLCNYLRRSATVSLERKYTLKPTDEHVAAYIFNTGVKYLCRFATCWEPSAWDISTHKGQKQFIDRIHERDPEIILEACIFECISPKLNKIPIPAYVFEAFSLPVKKKNFSYDEMRYADGRYENHWGKNKSVPDMTRTMTQMFFYFRACEYIKLGYEALHLGQVHLIGETDEGWVCWTRVLNLIRAFAQAEARRNFVLLNAHTHGILDANGKLMFDFHMYPMRIYPSETEKFFPTENRPQKAILKIGHMDSIYADSLGGMTYSGWECDSLPCLVELDNYGYDKKRLNIPDPENWMIYGMDEISWYANQPAYYRKEFLKYAYDFVLNEAPTDCFLAMPGQRVAYYFDDNQKLKKSQYFAYDPKNHPLGTGDENFIKEIWENDG